jgi:hypothetical protein
MKDFSVSPFPGMNPYLEGPVNWSDFHATFIHALREAINEVLPEAYAARVNELVMMVTPELPARKSVEPDVLISRMPSRESLSTAPESTAVLEPVVLANIEMLDPYTEAYIEILRLPEEMPVTVVELFSPTNKYGEGRGAYLDKRNRLLRTNINLFELDLIRAGPRLQLSSSPPEDDYLCYISRANERPNCDVYSWSVRQPLPVLPLPLRTPDPDIHVNLANPFQVAFSRGRYGRFIDYSAQPPAPRFSEADRSWIQRITGTNIT